jgi:hypothetical protein
MIINPNVIPEPNREAVSTGFDRYLDRRVAEVNRQDRAAWNALSSRAEWEAFKKPRIKALERSLGRYPRAAESIHFEVTGTIEGDGYVIEKVVFTSRENLLVTANIYRPPSSETDEAGSQQHETMRELGLAQNEETGIVLVHSHHNPRTQPELQDMGAMWARVGCVVLVMDLFAYGERGEHPAGPRHDYWNRYNTGIQLQLIGDSLMGWMVWDLRRGIDLLEQHYQVGKVVLMGSVAGGGDPCAVTAALDDRVSVAIPFNFGGPQPETVYPLPDDAETSFNYLGSGGWETTRNLAGSGRDGFLPWVIVGAIAPRHLIYAHEFAWDEERDPVWKRLQAIYRWYGAEDRLDHAIGFGLLKGRPPEASHCNNVGPPHRERIHVALNRWLDVDVPNEAEDRRDETDLHCFGEDGRPVDPDGEDAEGERSYLSAFRQIGQARGGQFRRSLAWSSTAEADIALRDAWVDLLGNCEPDAASDPVYYAKDEDDEGTVERLGLAVDEDVVVPVILLSGGGKGPVTVLISSEGKASVLRNQADMIQTRTAEGPVCLIDVRGIGEAGTDHPRAPQSRGAGRAATALMLGETVLGWQVKDLRTVIAYLRSRSDIRSDGIRIEDLASGWDSPGDAIELDRPLIEPGAHILARLVALIEDDVTWSGGSGRVETYLSLLDSWSVNWPYDVILPGAIPHGDLPFESS